MGLPLQMFARAASAGCAQIWRLDELVDNVFSHGEKDTGSDCVLDARGMRLKWQSNLASSWKEPKRRIEFSLDTTGRS
jgi:hypothetical protein